MHKITNFTGSAARHGWEKMAPSSFVTSRPSPANVVTDAHVLPASKRPLSGTPHSPSNPTDAGLNLCFNVPFSSNLAGPDGDDILHASPRALDRWLHPEGTPEGTPTYKLPIHARNLETLRQLCREACEGIGHPKLDATVTSSEPKGVSPLQRPSHKGLVTNVCLSGDAETVQNMRGRILKETPLALMCANVDVDKNLIVDVAADMVKPTVLAHVDTVADFTGTDIFVLGPSPSEIETIGTTFNGRPEISLDQRLRVAIYGDIESVEHAKTRVLIMIDQILKRAVDAMCLEGSLQVLVGGRSRKNIKLIESVTGTAIFFPPRFPRVYGYTPPGAARRREDEVIITGPTPLGIVQAKRRLHEVVVKTKCFTKEVALAPQKIDCMILDRLDKVRRITESNGTFILFPTLGSRQDRIRVQGMDVRSIERTIREIMNLAGQFYSASWWISPGDALTNGMRAPSPADVRTMLSDICANSGAEVSFEKFTFSIHGSDDAVKAAMAVIDEIPFVTQAQYQIKVQIELANEHKEFVSGKKNGKINKIMGQSNVQIIFDGYNEYNLYVDVCGARYDAVRSGLDLVEQEMPASISFHVPDQYHKRMIGIGGSHIQQTMKKYSVFVKFSNAQERGGLSGEEDDFRVDNVVCRTPARNAQSLDQVKQEIMEMIEKSDAEFVQERVIINRLYHRELIARMAEIEELESKWNCKIMFPSTEAASDAVMISGPEYQIPQAVDEFLGMVPESHEIVLPVSKELSQFLKSEQFHAEVQQKLMAQYEVELQVKGDGYSPAAGDRPSGPSQSLLLVYTRNNAGGLKDAIDFLVARLVAHGLDASTVKASIPRPKSDSFEDNLPFFDSKLLQNAPAPVVTESPTKATGADEHSERSIFDRLRKPGGMSTLSSFIERRRNPPSQSGSIFRNGSNNCSKTSLISVESYASSYRNPWNDSAVNLPEDELHGVNGGWPSRDQLQHGYNNNNNNKMTSPTGTVGDSTPRYDVRASIDSGRPSTSHSMGGVLGGYPGFNSVSGAGGMGPGTGPAPGPIGPPR